MQGLWKWLEPIDRNVKEIYYKNRKRNMLSRIIHSHLVFTTTDEGWKQSAA